MSQTSGRSANQGGWSTLQPLQLLSVTVTVEPYRGFSLPSKMRLPSYLTFATTTSSSPARITLVTLFELTPTYLLTTRGAWTYMGCVLRGAILLCSARRLPQILDCFIQQYQQRGGPATSLLESVPGLGSNGACWFLRRTCGLTTLVRNAAQGAPTSWYSSVLMNGDVITNHLIPVPHSQ